MTKRNNWIKLGFMLFLSIGLSILFIRSTFFDINTVENLAPDFHYNAISMSAIIGGFLFTGIGILISAIDKERVNRLWNNNYLDNLYRSAFVGMIADVITIISAFLLLSLNFYEKVEGILIQVEISTLIIGIIFFAWCIRYLIYLISKLKDDQN